LPPPRSSRTPKIPSLDLNANGHAAAPDDNHDEIDQGVSTMIHKAKPPSIGGKSTGLDLVKVAFQIKSAYTESVYQNTS